MKLSAILAVVAAAAVSVGAVPAETNADRLARGLPPLPPVRRGTPVAAKRSSPSGTPGPCSSGTLECCTLLTTANDIRASIIIKLLGITVAPDVPVGVNCSPLSPFLYSLGSCSTGAACCENTSYGIQLAVGCYRPNP